MKAASCSQLITVHHRAVMTSFRSCKPHHIAHASSNDSHTPNKVWRMIMKTLLSAVLALTVLTGVAASANAFDAKTFYQEQDRSRY
jgi:hypothetical protein